MTVPLVKFCFDAGSPCSLNISYLPQHFGLFKPSSDIIQYIPQFKFSKAISDAGAPLAPSLSQLTRPGVTAESVTLMPPPATFRHSDMVSLMKYTEVYIDIWEINGDEYTYKNLENLLRNASLLCGFSKMNISTPILMSSLPYRWFHTFQLWGKTWIMYYLYIFFTNVYKWCIHHDMKRPTPRG